MHAVDHWTLTHASLLLVAAAASLGIGHAWPACLVGAASLCWLVARERAQWTPTGVFGPANGLTVLRATVLLGGAWLQPEHMKGALWVSVVFALDGLDGWVARHYRCASDFGARFDMETDALLVLLVGLVLLHRDVLGVWILLPGALRCLYVLVTPLLPRDGEAPRTRLGRYTFAVMVSALALAFVLPAPWPSAVAGAATTLLCLSFGRSLSWNLRVR